MKEWNKPELNALGYENTLCEEYDLGLLPSHGQDDVNGGPGNSGKYPCPVLGCNHGCPNEKVLAEHIANVHGGVAVAS